MKKIILCGLLSLFVCGLVCALDLDHFGKRGATNDGSFYISLYDKDERNGIVLLLSPSSLGNERAKLIVVDNKVFSILSPEGLILDNTSKFAEFIVAVFDSWKNKVSLANYRADYEAGIDTIILKQDYDGTEAFIDTLMLSLLKDRKLVLSVSAIDLDKNQELEIGTTKVFDYDVIINTKELEDAYIDYTIWLVLMSGWQI